MGWGSPSDPIGAIAKVLHDFSVEFREGNAALDAADMRIRDTMRRAVLGDRGANYLEQRRRQLEQQSRQRAGAGTSVTGRPRAGAFGSAALYTPRGGRIEMTAKEKIKRFNASQGDAVWMGGDTFEQKRSTGKGKGGVTEFKTPRAYSVAEAKARPFRSPEDLSKMMAKYGYEPGDVAGFQADWNNAVEMANQSWIATRGGAKGKLTSPSQYMALTAKPGGRGSGGSGMKAGTTTSVAKSVDTITDGQAWGYLTNTLQDMLGRKPTDAELHRFIAKAKDVAAANPRVTKTTTKTDGKGNVSESSKSSGGAAEGDFMLAAQNMAATPEAGAFQAASTYMNALMSALDSPVNLR